VVSFAIVWGVVVVALGMTQDSLLIGELHWIIQVLHLLVGLGAVGQAETLARQTRGRVGHAHVDRQTEASFQPMTPLIELAAQST
jgi:hypothetical protein